MKEKEITSSEGETQAVAVQGDGESMEGTGAAADSELVRRVNVKVRDDEVPRPRERALRVARRYSRLKTRAEQCVAAAAKCSSYDFFKCVRRPMNAGVGRIWVANEVDMQNRFEVP
jgi:hypothetical protein